MRAVVLLAKLNEADSAVDALKKRSAEIDESLREPAILSKARGMLAELEAALVRCIAIHTERESSQQDIAAKLARSETRLYSGEISNSRGVEDAERDVQQLRRQLSQADDILLEALIALDEATERRDTIRDKLAHLNAEWEARQVRLRAEQARLQARLPAAVALQAGARKVAPVKFLPLYDSLRKRRGGMVVASVEGDVCAACGVAVPPTKLDAALYGDELTYCGSCGRLLWGE